MTAFAHPMPAFGQADLSNCEREQIHLAASIQPHGVLLLVHGSDFAMVQASANAAAYLGLDASPIGRPLTDLGGTLARQVAALTLPLAEPAPFRTTLAGGIEWDAMVHEAAEGGLIVELERAASRRELGLSVERAVRSIVGTASLRALCEESATLFKSLTGYDRVMVYRFDQYGHGEVFSERREQHLEAFLGNWYPASDIPQIARQLYMRTRVRVLVDVGYDPVPLEPRLCPLSGGDLDMSLCFLRSMSPIHIQYLKNMGVGATLVVSIVVGGTLWGMIACHHYAPRTIGFETRAACELIAETIATRIAALESFAQAQAEMSVRRLEQRMIEAITQEGDWRTALFDNPQALLAPLGASGAVLLFENQHLSAGEVPGTPQLREIAAWLDTLPRQSVMATATLGSDAPFLAASGSVASGLVATPLSALPGEYLVWFRPERIRMKTWGGDPLEPVIIGNDPSDLSPRRSFAKWHQLVEGTCEPWSPADLTAARLIGETVTDVVVQFRAVRLLIARDQFESVTRQVDRADMPVVIADAAGRVQQTNRAFLALIAGRAEPATLSDLATLFCDPKDAAGRLRDLVERRRTWRGETALQNGAGPHPMLVRGDPVLAPPDRVLGYVLLFTDLAGRSAAADAERLLQERLLDRRRLVADDRGDPTYQRLLAAVLENAQLAALEVTDGVDKTRMTQMLDSIGASADRATARLSRLFARDGARSG